MEDAEEQAEARIEIERSAGTETILLVEDDQSIRGLVAESLARCGYTVIEAGDATAALDRASRHSGRIDLMITDIVMPEVNGIELAALRKERLPNVPVLFITGYAPEQFGRTLEVSAPDGFLAKPFTMRDLADKIRELLDARPQSHGSAASNA